MQKSVKGCTVAKLQEENIGSFPTSGGSKRNMPAASDSKAPTSISYISDKLREINLLGSAVDDIKRSFRPSPITDTLFLGGRNDAVNYQTLHVAGIRLILCVAEEHAQEVRKQPTRFGKIVVPQRKSAGSSSGELFEPAPGGVRSMEDFINFMREDVTNQNLRKAQQQQTKSNDVTSSDNRRSESGAETLNARAEEDSLGVQSTAGVSEADEPGTDHAHKLKEGMAHSRSASVDPSLIKKNIVTKLGCGAIKRTTKRKSSPSTTSSKSIEEGASSRLSPANKRSVSPSSSRTKKTYSFYWACIPVRDVLSTKLNKYFDETSQLLEAAEINGNAGGGGGSACGGKVLVHCLAGRSRSVSIICAYLIKRLVEAQTLAAMSDPTTPTFTLKVPLTVAVLDFMRERRMCVQPNESFHHQLLEWEQKLQLQVIHEKQQRRWPPSSPSNLPVTE